MGSGMGGHPGPSDRSREKELVHRNRYRGGGSAGEQLEIRPPKNPPPPPKPWAPIRLWEWISRRWNGD
ncbi:MAG: hypothetical protein EA415_13285 [Sphaerobacteraceae bacterium]|nr:MAG: hypothetical protein EA415_13285 [Sphaerobacteraceae bacterium]